MMYIPIPDVVVSQSSVLSSIVEAGGDARLPEVVSLSEFRTWVQSITDPAILHSWEHMDQRCTLLKVCICRARPLTQHVTCTCRSSRVEAFHRSVPAVLRARLVVQVADALDAVDFDEMLGSIAYSLQAEAVHRSNGADPDPEMSEALAKLPVHLQQRVLESIMSSEDEEEFSQKMRLDLMLELLPVHHHDALVAAAITTDKALLIPDQRNYWLPSVIETLAQLPASPPAILSLELHCDMRYGDRGMEARTSCADSTPTLRIAEAIRHHSSMTSLSIAIPGLRASAALQPVAQAIATLTSLQALNLHNTFTAEAGDVLKAVLTPLSLLQDLSLSLHSADSMLHSLKRGREGGMPGEVPQHCLSDIFSSSTALTSLKLVSQDGKFTASTPLRLPCLSHVHVTGSRHSVASALLRHLTAPLSTLQITDIASAAWQPGDVDHTQQLLHSLPRFQQLRSLAINLDVQGEARHRRAALTGASAALGSLSTLQELSISSDVFVLVRAVISVAANAAGLQRLRVSCGWHARTRPPSLLRAEVASSWRALFSRLRRVELRHLDIHVCNALAWGVLPGMRAGAQQLTHLTALHVSGWERCVGSQQDCEALASLQALQSLCFQGAAVGPEVQPHLSRALGALPKLTQLAVRVGADSLDGILRQSERWNSDFAQHAHAAAWPSLRWLGVTVLSREQAEALVAAVSAFPALETVVLEPTHRHWQPEFQTRGHLDRVASGAGVCLEWHVDRERFAWKSAWA